MSKPRGYNGHRSRNAWNVALWIGNDEGLYRLARECIRRTRTLDDAADRLLCMLAEAAPDGNPRTPDGAPYTKTTVRAALSGLS